jgi:5'(3')-deoxyribonucleotidase
MIKQIIYCDLDGVVASFAQGYKQQFNRNAYKDDSFTINQFCRQSPHFFRFLPVIPEGLELLLQLKQKYTVVFLTTPMEGMPYCKWDKIAWVEENIGKEFDVIFEKDKAKYVVDSKSILVDDMSYNLRPWIDAGGTAIKFPQKSDKILAIIESALHPDVSDTKKQLQAMDIDMEPTEAQKLSGNYKKGIVNFKGLKIAIENPKGSIRWGFDASGRKWINKMQAHYGYIVGSEGADCDPVDVFIGPKLGASRVFVINQGRDGMFDEHKIMLGYDTIEEAETDYMANYQKGWDGLMSIHQTNTKKIRDWIKTRNAKEPFYPNGFSILENEIEVMPDGE